MAEKGMLIISKLMRGTGILIIYCSLILIAAHYFTWGLAALLLGLAVLGFNGEGQNS